MLKALDVFFMVFHSLFVVFNLFGWMFYSTRRWNLLLLLITGSSWFILGIFYGIGYCPLTDWHFKILTELGHTGLPNSYMKYMADRLTGSDLNARLVDLFTFIGYIAALAVSLWLNIRDFRRRMQRKPETK